MIYHQSSFEKWPLEDESVQAITTSPPYWSLRRYDIPEVVIDGWQGQYGLESNIDSYIEHTLLWCKEAYRVLKKDGIFWLNLGDSWNNRIGIIGRQDKSKYGGKNDIHCLRGGDKKYLPGCKNLLPHRIAIALVDKGKWSLRNDIVWIKPNCLPESVKNRFSKKFEFVFMFVKNKDYYFNLDAVREPYKETREHKASQKEMDNYDEGKRYIIDKMYKGKNPGDTWFISNQMLCFQKSW